MGRQQGIEIELSDSRAKIQEIESVVVKNVTSANKTVEQELSRFEKIIAALEKYIETQVGEVKSQQASNLDEWRNARGDSFGELARKQEEMQTSFSLLTQNLGKVEEDARERALQVRDELRNVEAAQAQQLADLTTKLNLELAAVNSKTTNGLERLASKTNEDFEAMEKSTNKTISGTMAELNNRFQENNNDIEKYVGDQLNKLRTSLAQERVKMDTILEGKNQEFTVEAEKRILNKVATILDENARFKSDVYSKLEQQLGDTRKMYRETKEDRMLFDSKLASKLAEVKEWVLKQVSDSYDDSTRMTEAKIKELDSQLRADEGLANFNSKVDAAKDSRRVGSTKPDGDLREEVIKLLEDDRRLKNMRFDELFQLVDNNKTMQSELIAQQFDSQKALVKAIINKEVAERTAADEELAASMSRQISRFIQSQGESLVDIQDKTKALEGKIENQRIDTENKIAQSDQAITLKLRNEQAELAGDIVEVRNLVDKLGDDVATLKVDLAGGEYGDFAIGKGSTSPENKKYDEGDFGNSYQDQNKQSVQSDEKKDSSVRLNKKLTTSSHKDQAVVVNPDQDTVRKEGGYPEIVSVILGNRQEAVDVILQSVGQNNFVIKIEQAGDVQCFERTNDHEDSGIFIAQGDK